MRTKYPRSMNLPYSGSNSSDDVWWKDTSLFDNQEVVITHKMDGECTTIYPDGYVHARSIDTNHHPSRAWVKALAGRMAHNIPEGFRVCGENLYAYHSIFYKELPSYFLVFGIYDHHVCLSWAETEEWCRLLELHTVPVLYKGIWRPTLHQELWTGRCPYPTFESSDPNDRSSKLVECESEGYVVRLAREFYYDDFSKCCAKYVKPFHVKTSAHWMTEQVIPNQLAE